MDINQKILITKYLDGELNGDELEEVCRLMIEDEEFNKRLLTRKSLREVEETVNQIEQEEELEELLKQHHQQKKKVSFKINRSSYFRLAAITGIAATIIIAFFIFNQPIDKLDLNVNYYQVNFKGGSGINSSEPKNKPTFIKKTKIYFEANKSAADTFYLINTDSLKIIVPKITQDLNQQKFALTFDYAIKKLLLTIDKDTFEIKNSSQKEKLVRFKR